MKKQYHLSICQDTLNVLMLSSAKELQRARRKLMKIIFTILLIIAAAITYDSMKHQGIHLLAGVAIGFGVPAMIFIYVGLMSGPQGKKEQLERLLMYKTMFKNEQLEDSKISKLINIQPVPTLTFTEKDTPEDRRRKEREAARVEEDNRRKQQAFREYAEDGIASIHDLARVTSRGLKFIKEDFDFFINNKLTLNLEIDANNGCFIVGGERMQKWTRYTQPITNQTTNSVCGGCGALRKNPQAAACEYCATVF